MSHFLLINRNGRAKYEITKVAKYQKHESLYIGLVQNKERKKNPTTHKFHSRPPNSVGIRCLIQVKLATIARAVYIYV